MAAFRDLQMVFDDLQSQIYEPRFQDWRTYVVDAENAAYWVEARMADLESEIAAAQVAPW